MGCGIAKGRQMMAAGAEAIGGGGLHRHVNLIDLYLALVGEEGVARRELRQGRVGGPAVAMQGDAVFLAAYRPGAVDDGRQRDPLLGKGVVGQEAGVGHSLQQLLVVQLLDALAEGGPLLLQDLDLPRGLFVLGTLTQPPQLLGDLAAPRLPGLALGQHLLEKAEKAGAQVLLLLVALDIAFQLGPGRRGQVLAQEAAKGVEQLGLPPIDEIQIVERKPPRLALTLGYLVQGLAQPVGHAGALLRHPMVEEEGIELPPQHLRRPQVDRRRLHRPLQHLQRIAEEVLVMPLRGGIGDSEDGRITVQAAGATDALDETRLVWRHPAQHHAGQGADVDAHLQGRRRREQVLEPGPRLLRPGHEAVLQFHALIPLQQARVFMGDHPPHLPAQEPLAPPAGGPASALAGIGSGKDIGIGCQALGGAVPGRQAGYPPEGVRGHPERLGTRGRD